MNKMKKQFVTYPIALALKELGFDDFKMFGWYIKEDDSEFGKSLHIVGNKDFYFNPEFCFKAPLYQQVIDYFRTQHGTHIAVYRQVDIGNRKIFVGMLEVWNEEDEIDYDFSDCFYTYEEAREAAILQAIEIIKNK